MVAPGCLRPNTKRSDPKDIGELDHDLADRVWTMMQHAPHRALVPVSLYRDPGRQWELRHERCPGHECNFARCKGYPTTATPYGSNHPKRLAADLGGRDLDWAWRNARRFGLITPVKGEKWHFQKSGAPQVEIIPYPGKRWDDPERPPAPVDPNEGRPFRTFVAGANDATIYALGGRDNQIAELQILTGNRVTGVYDEATVRSVVALKAAAKWADASGVQDRSSRVTERFMDAVRGLAGKS